MIVKLADVILALLIELASVILILWMEVLAGIILATLLKKPCAGSKADKYYSYSINRNTGRCYPYTIIESH